MGGYRGQQVAKYDHNPGRFNDLDEAPGPNHSQKMKNDDQVDLRFTNYLLSET